MTDPTQEFRQTLQAAGLTPPDMIIPGKLYRIPSNDRRGDTAGWCKLFEDGMGGVYGDHRSSTSETWQFRKADRMSDADRESFRQQVEQARRERDAAQAASHREAANKAADLWAKANPHPDTNHAYLIRKGVPAVAVRQMDDALLVPLYGDDKNLVGLQFIRSDGQKRFITGTRKAGSWCVLKPEGIPPADWKVILIAEGWATAASLHTATRKPVFIAFDCGNLSAVARYIRQQFPAARLLFCADDDAHGKGLHHAQQAARQNNGMAIIPKWEGIPNMTPEQLAKATDFNDLHVLAGLDAVRAQIDTASLGLDAKGDAVDWLERHPDATATEVLALPTMDSGMDNPVGPNSQEGGIGNSSNADTEAGDGDVAETEEQMIARLAGLSKLAYFRVQKASAEALGITPGNLDKLVNEERRRMQDDDQSTPGGTVIFEDVEPWPAPVDGNALLNDITAAVRRFTVLSVEQARAVALWSAFTWFIDGANVAPLLNITSPEKRCGKSTLLLVAGELAAKPILASNITAAALFRSIEVWTPTLLIDEADTFLANSDDLRGVINAGHYRKTAFVIRTVGDDHQPKAFTVWCAKVISGIGKVAGTIIDRSIVIEMRRKLSGEKVDNIHMTNLEFFGEYRSKLLRWRDDCIGEFRANRPERILGINDRAADNWQPLQAIAALAGGKWPEQCRLAAIALSGVEADAPSINVELLMDCAEVFHAQNATKLFTADLLEALNDDEEKPWAAWNRGKPLNAHQLSKRLSEFGIKPGEIRIGQLHKKGYALPPFNEAIIRYGTASAIPGFESATPRQPLRDKALAPNEKRDNAENVADSKSPEPLQPNECRGVAFPEEVEL